jgi:CBS domain containing-hemolysin-like protein
MSPLLSALVLLLVVAASGLFSGAETGLYSLSRSRVVGGGRGRDLRAGLERLARGLLADEVGLLITLLVGNNLVNQLATYAGRGVIRPLGLPPGASELALTVCLTPLLFLFGELFPKDLFRRRPHALVPLAAPAIWGARALLYPVVALLGALARFAERSVGLDGHGLARVHGREEGVLELVRQGGRGLRSERLEGMARNVLGLRALRIERAMIPWRRVRTVALEESPSAELADVPYSRVPVTDAAGHLRGYVHLTDVLHAGPGVPLAAHLRPLILLEPDLPIERALARMRSSGLRMAAVGSAERPLGIVTLKDLVEEISGELARW